MERLIKKRTTLKGQLTRIEKYFQNLELNEAILENVKERIERVNHIFSEYEIIQFEIENHVECEDSTDQHEAERTLTENKYLNIKAKGKFFCNELSPDNTASNISNGSSSGLSGAIQSLMHHQAALAELISKMPTGISGNNNQNINNQQVAEVRSQIKMQPIEIPTFNGNYKEWPEFYDLFNSMIHNNQRFSPCEKLQYLKRALIGNASNILKNLIITDANYIQAYEELVNTFNKKEVIIDSYLQTIMDQPKIYTVTAEVLRSLCSNMNESVRALTALNLPTDQWDRWLIFILCSKLDNESLKLWRRDCAQKPENQIITFANLITFISNRIYEITPVKRNVYELNQKKNDSRGKLSHTIITVNSCYMCQGEHGIYSCQTFLKLSTTARRDFIRKKGLCFNCLKGKHIVKDCTSKSMCKYCESKHNSLLHEAKNNEKSHVKYCKGDSNQKNDSNQRSDSQSKVSLHSNVKQFDVQTGILPTAVVLIKDNDNEFQKCRVLLDTGSQVNLVSENCMQRLRLNRTNARIPINGVGAARVECTRGKVDMVVKSRFNKFQIGVQALILKKVTANIPSVQMATNNINFFKDMDLADPEYFIPAKIDMILGSDIFFLSLENGKNYDHRDACMAQKTKFGWIVSRQGSIINSPYTNSFHSCINIDQRLKLFWEMEELPNKSLYTDEEQEAENYFADNVTRDTEGRYVVRLPFKKNINDQLGSSRKNALYTLKSLERRFEKDPKLKTEYVKFINEYIDLKHMKQVSENKISISESNSFYLPHHAVFKESSTTTKLRVVFDASRKTSTGILLNNVLLVGPTIQRDIWSLLLNFRKHKVAYTADISKMYRQINMDERDTSFQRILWREFITDEIKEYELQTVTYGTASAPYLAIRCLKQLAIDDGDKFKTGAENLLNNFYVDDFMGGSHTVEDAVIEKEELSELLSRGGFDIRKWSSNSEELLATIAEPYREESFSLPLQEDTTVKILGLRWHAAWDCFTFDVNIEDQIVYTKRNIVAEISKLYDPLGFLGPCIVLAKLIIQQIWILGIGWDDQLPDELITKYRNFRNNLTQLSKL